MALSERKGSYVVRDRNAPVGGTDGHGRPRSLMLAGGRPGEAHVPAAVEAGPAPALAPVLLVEDDEVHARIVEASLAGAKLTNPVVRARTGDEAAAWIEDVSRPGSTGPPVLVLLDLELPGRSGLTVLERLRDLGGGIGSCPVIMMSGSCDDGAIARARQLGVRGYLVKPVAFDALVDVVRGLDMPWALIPGDGT